MEWSNCLGEGSKQFLKAAVIYGANASGKSNLIEALAELSSTANKISFARQAYNDSVTSYNNKRESFPTNFMANIFDFSPATLFEVAEPTERENVEVKF